MRWLEGALRFVSAVDKVLLAACRHLTIGLVASITVIVCAGVFWRYVLNDALAWSEETAKFLMVWMVFVAAPIALARGGHAAIDTLPSSLPARAGQAVYALIYLVVLLFVLVLIDQGTAFALNARVQHTPTTGISMMYVFAAMPVGGVILAMVSVEMLLRSLLGIADPERGVHLSERDQVAMSPE